MLKPLRCGRLCRWRHVTREMKSRLVKYSAQRKSRMSCLMGEQPRLAIQTARIAGQLGVGTYHAMARDHDGNGIGTVRATHCSHGGGLADESRLLPVCPCLSRWNGSQRCPAPPLKLGAAQRNFERIDRCEIAFKIAPQRRFRHAYVPGLQAGRLSKAPPNGFRINLPEFQKHQSAQCIERRVNRAYRPKRLRKEQRCGTRKQWFPFPACGFSDQFDGSDFMRRLRSRWCVWKLASAESCRESRCLLRREFTRPLRDGEVSTSGYAPQLWTSNFIVKV